MSTRESTNNINKELYDSYLYYQKRFSKMTWPEIASELKRATHESIESINRLVKLNNEQIELVNNKFKFI